VPQEEEEEEEEEDIGMACVKWNYSDRSEAKYLVGNVSWWHSIPVWTGLAWD